MIERLDKAVLARELGRETVTKGARVRAGSGVRALEATPDGAQILSSVASEQGRAPYQQTISVKQRDGKLHVVGYCTCPMRRDCKHVAAALLEHVARSGVAQPVAAVWSARPVTPALSARAASVAEVLPPSPLEADTGLSKEVDEWLEMLGRAAVQASADTDPPAGRTARRERGLLFIMSPRGLAWSVRSAHTVVRPVSVRLGSDGTISDEKPFAPENAMRSAGQRARYLSPADISLLSDLYWLQRLRSPVSVNDVVLPPTAAGRYLLESLIATRRLHWGSIEGPVLSSGPAIAAVPRWTTDAIGRQRLAMVPAAADDSDQFDAVLPLSPLQYVDVSRGRLGPITSTLPDAIALEVARSPSVSASEAALVGATMRDRLSVPHRQTERSSSRATSRPTVAREADAAPQGAIAGDLLLPLPDAAGVVELRTVRPTPRLRLAMADVRLRNPYAHYLHYPMFARFRDRFRLPVAHLSFDYDGEAISPGDSRRYLERRVDDTLIVSARDGATEAAAFKRLGQLGLGPIERSPVVVDAAAAGVLFLGNGEALATLQQLETLDQKERFISFSMDAVPKLQSEGWLVDIDEHYPYRVATGKVGWWADVGEGSGLDWFSFEVGIEFEGDKINLVPMLEQVLDKLPPGMGGAGAKRLLEEALEQVTLYQELADGRLLPIPGARLVPLVIGLMDLVGPRRDTVVAGKIRLNRAEAPALADFAKATDQNVAWAAGAERLVELGRTLQRGRPRTSIKPPKGFEAKLRPYQAQGLAWMDFLRESGFGGVLADDMGLGKTVQALAFLSREKAEGRLDMPALIVSPTSVLPNWMAEAARFAPGLRMLALRGPDRQQLFGEIANHDVVLSTYPLLVRDAPVLLGQEFHVAILDEAQAIKNAKAAISETAHKIKARHRLALTGTPLENNLGEVWSLFAFLAPGLLGDSTSFKRLFRTPIEKHGDKAAQSFLTRRLKPFMLRRTKEEVAPELPQKTEITELVRLDGGQRDLYETVRTVMHKKVREAIDKKGLAKSHIVFLDALLKLRQVCCDPRLLKMPHAARVRESAKLERLMEMIPEMLAEGRRILLFSQFTSMLALIEAELTALQIPYVMLTGETVDRAAPVRRFQAGEVPLFLISLKAGGSGLNLTAADTVIHYDPWWNPAVERQATDRAHRIGQTKPVFVYRLIAEEGIEQAIELLKARKAALAEALFEGSAKTLGDLTESDVAALFAPLSSVRPRRKVA